MAIFSCQAVLLKSLIRAYNLREIILDRDTSLAAPWHAIQ
jgi:hypothetical protein